MGKQHLDLFSLSSVRNICVRQCEVTQTPSVAARHNGGGPGLIDEGELRRIKIELGIEPLLWSRQDVGVIVLWGLPGISCAMRYSHC
ncbi:hypothetical protein AOR01nite_25610 [Acetobacter orleanensis]|uniref:Uncharacterized protein n=2 Tax=Acetobacter orleanensis TaxID=104099 RepID=A0A4Y3TQN4_9PROT|nr:hypothetical protein Abol_037_003 [Acetobacter orleanensis JCM 7639]GEB84084.1 hypothetical protein AOR01nite_25610 [Acetobacter orleanensis]